MNKKTIIGILIFVILIGAIILVKNLSSKGGILDNSLTTVYVATGGGKEDFLKEFGGIEMVKYDLEMRKTIDKLKELNK